MKKLISIITLIFISALATAQAPQGMNYQAVARNVAGAILANQNIGVRITITNGNGGSTLYQETHNTTTNQFGLFTLNAGNGTVVSGVFANIQWSSVAPWMQVEMDATGGTSYVLMGTSQMLSVPYSLYSASGGTTYTQGAGINIAGTIINNNINQLDSLNDVNTTGAASGLVLKYNGAEWVPATDNTSSSSGGVNVTPRLSGDGTAGDPIDIAQQAAAAGEVLKWNGTSWAPASDNGTSYTGGTGINVAGTVITNTGDTDASNDITNATTATGDLSGTYPAPVVKGLQGVGIATTAPTNAQVLKYNGSQWAPAADNNTTYTQGTGINIAGTVITNTGDTDASNDITNTTTAAGDLNGTYPNPGVAKIRGVNVAATAPTAGQVLKYDGANWTPGNDSLGSPATNYWTLTGSDIYSNNSGNAGIGSFAPEARLHVKAVTPLPQLQLGNNNQPTSEWQFNVNGASNLSILNENNATPVMFMNSSSGNIGMSMITPQAKLHILSVSPTPQLQLGNSLHPSIEWQFNVDASSDMSVLNEFSASPIMFMNHTSGNVGIATVSPQSKLHITSAFPAAQLQLGNVVQPTLEWKFNVDSLANMFVSNESLGIPVMSMDHLSGNVGIGTNTPESKLHLKGTVDWSQLIIDANTTQSNVYPLIKLRNSAGVDLLSITSDANVNTFVGINSGRANNFITGVQGDRNTFIGSNSGYANTTGRLNTVTGTNALSTNSAGNENTAIGASALANSNANYNVAVGSAALSTNSSGGSNTGIGTYALISNTTGSSNTATGRNALYSNLDGNMNTASGSNALYTNTSGDDNTAAGSSALYLNATGTSNTAVGSNALRANTQGIENTATGTFSLYANTLGSYNTACGMYALQGNLTGSNNTALGYGAYQTGTAYSNSMALGTSAIAITASGMVRVGAITVNSIGGQVGWTTLSDARIKKDVQENVPGLAFINALRPVTYHYDTDRENELLGSKKQEGEWEGKDDISKMQFSGFLAQEVEAAANNIGYHFSGVDKSGALMGLRYAEFVVPLVKAVQELSKQNELLKKEIDELSKGLPVEKKK